jgi:hypothetical protein
MENKNIKIKINYNQNGGAWSVGDYVATSSGNGTIDSIINLGIGFEIVYNVKLNSGTIVSVSLSDLKEVVLTPRSPSSSPSSPTRSIGTDTSDIRTPTSVNQKDILTLIALNTIRENIRDMNRPLIQPYSPYLESTKYNIQDIGDNVDLQEDITDFFYKKTLKWLTNDIEFNKIKKVLKIIKTNKGEHYIYKILKSFVKKNKVNWYELRNEKNYEDVKDYIRQKLSSL